MVDFDDQTKQANLLKHLINPQIDCVFKAILGADENKPALIHFLNAIIKPRQPVTAVEILNPYNEKEFLNDKLSIVDIKARDEAGTIIQIEIQMTLYASLPNRMLYSWSDIYGAQLESGQDFDQLKPVISIWLLSDNMFTKDNTYHHHFQMVDLQCQTILSEHCAIHVLEIEKWQHQTNLSDEDQWLYFFKDGRHWSELPEEINHPALRQAMATLKRFSEKEKNYHAYQARENFLREERTKQKELEAAKREAEEIKKALNTAIQEKQAAQQAEKAAQEAEKAAQEAEKAAQEAEKAALKAEKAALEEQERLRQLLKQSGIDPDA